MSNEYENLCDKCGKDEDTLYGKGLCNGNKNPDMMCPQCFEEVFDEPAES